MKQILETQRLYLREMEQGDFAALAALLQDSDVMVYYSHDFTDADVQEWLDRQRKRYEEYGFGLWAACLKETDAMIGQCGIAMQPVKGEMVPEIGYLFQKEYWHKGFAIEVAAACREYGFSKLGFNELYSLIRNTNTSSQKVAVRNGMRYRFTYTADSFGNEVETMAYSIRRLEAEGIEKAETET